MQIILFQMPTLELFSDIVIRSLNILSRIIKIVYLLIKRMLNIFVEFRSNEFDLVKDKK